MESTVIHGIQPQELQTLIAAAINQALQSRHQADPDRLLTIRDLCDALKVDESTIYGWRRKGKLRAFAIGGRTFYRWADVVGSLREIQ